MDIPSTTAPMTWWTLPSFWLAWVLARRWTAGAKGLTAGAAGRSAAARRDLATPLWEEKSSASGSMASRRGGGVLLEHDGGVYGEIWVERRERCSLREVDRQGRGLRFRSGELARSEKRTALPDACLARALLQRDHEQCSRLRGASPPIHSGDYMCSLVVYKFLCCLYILIPTSLHVVRTTRAFLTTFAPA